MAGLVKIEIRLMEMCIGSRISRVWLLAKVSVRSLPIWFFFVLDILDVKVSLAL